MMDKRISSRGKLEVFQKERMIQKIESMSVCTENGIKLTRDVERKTEIIKAN